MIVVFAVPPLDKIRVDDAVGAMPVHLLAGISGTLAVPLANIDATLLAQIIGIGAIGAFVSVSSLVVWLVLRFTIGLRPSFEQETDGMDQTETGLEAYPEFGEGSQRVKSRPQAAYVQTCFPAGALVGSGHLWSQEVKGPPNRTALHKFCANKSYCRFFRRS